MKGKNKAIVILGPTSTGKSGVAIKLANKLNGEVISADSRQVYKDMNLGTGKVEGKWTKRDDKRVFISDDVVHHLIDFRSPRGKYNVSHFKRDCRRLIVEITSRGKLPIICGGTGFWISAVIDDLKLPEVEPDKKLRRELAKKTTGQLFAQLEKLDPRRAKKIDKNNKFRLIRAIEICKALGIVPKLNYSKFKIQDSRFLQIGLDWPQDKLDEKIEKRLQGRWAAGMVKEVVVLREKYNLSWKKIQSFGLAYYWIPAYLREKIDLEQLKEKVFRAERGYAKRQRTWFKRDKRIIWENDYGKISKLVKEFLAR